MFRASSGFDKLLDKATSNLLLEVDIFSVVQICDLIRQKDCPPKYAVQAIKRKFSNPNPHTVYYALQVLESVVKNCGTPIYEEVATKEFMESMRELAKICPHENVREKVLELVQTWAHAFRKYPSYRAVQDVLNIMKAEGLKFPSLVEADTMFTADTAPEWQDGGCCNRCRVEFGIMNRKHHCRACGQIFCGKCSSKTTPLPKFGIEKEVRVCDSCFDKFGKQPKTPTTSTTKKNSSDSPADPLQKAIEASLADLKAKPSKQSTPRGKTAEELEQEENEQLELALAISQSEAEAKEREKMERKFNSMRITSQPQSPEVSTMNGSILKKDSQSPTTTGVVLQQADEDPDLSRYLNRSYWEERHSAKTEANDSRSTPTSSITTFQPSAPVKENRNKTEQAEELDNFVAILREQIDMFVNRMKSNSSRGRHISNDTSVQSLFMNLTAMHSQLLNYIHAQDDARSYYEGLQDKVSQARDARDALDALRKEHEDQRRAAAEEAERQRQIQMAVKLNDMRQKKHQYLQYQQNLAIQRVQEEQRIMQARLEQQRMMSVPGQPQQQYYAGYGHPGMVQPGQPGNPIQYQMPPPGQPGMMGPPGPPQMQHPIPQGQYQPGLSEHQQQQQHYAYHPANSGQMSMGPGPQPQTQDQTQMPPQQMHQYYIPQHQQQQMNHAPPASGPGPTSDMTQGQPQNQHVQPMMSPPPQQTQQQQVEIANLIDF